MKKLLISMTLMVCGCTTLIPGNENPRSPKPLPGIVSAAVDISHEKPIFFASVDEDLDENETQWTVTAENGDSLNFKYLKSELNGDKKHDVIFIYNILKDKDQTVSGLLADALLGKGFDCIIIQQEYFLSHTWVRPLVGRLNDLGDPTNPHKSYDAYNAYLAQSVGRIIKYWVPTRSELTGRYGFVGVSLGGIHAVAAAAIFPDSIMTVALMAGGSNLDLFRTSQESLVLYNKDKLESWYATRLAELHPDARIDWMRALEHDITSLKFKVLELARCVDTNKIKLMITLNDTSVPTSCQWRLFYALGGPETRLFPGGHYTMILHYVFTDTIEEQLQDWMVEAFQKTK